MAINLKAEEQEGTEQYEIKKFVDLIRPEIENLGYKITTQAVLPYTNFCDKINEAGKGLDYTKGQKAYVTDALIYEPLANGDSIPLVVLEGKIKTQTTHDVITYTEKAKAHKNVFPHLRYGFIVLEAKGEKFPDFYYQHAGFDFEEVFPSNETPEQTQIRTNEFVAELTSQIKKAKEKHQRFFKSEA